MSNIDTKRGVTVKKTIFLLSLLVILLCSVINVNAEMLYYDDAYHYYDAGVIGLKINGKPVYGLPMQPVIINDYTMVPVREVFEALGDEIIWHDSTCQVEIKGKRTSVFVKIGDRNVVVNGKTVEIEEPQPLPMLIGNSPSVLKSMVPVRFIAEKLGYKVEWDGVSRTVLISDKESDSGFIYGESDEPETPPVVTPPQIVMPDEKGSFGTVLVESDSKYDYIYISTRYGISPKITRYANPDRVVFDFPGATFLSKGETLTLNGNCVKTVRYSNFESQARLVLDITDSTQAFVMSSDKGIMIRAQKSANDEVIYDAFSQRVYFNKAYAGSGVSVDNGYKVTFTNLKLSTQKIEIHDKNIYEINIVSTSSGCTVTVDGSNKLTYTAEKGFYKSDKVPETPVKPPVNVTGKKKVVLDPGHGGNDPGAVGYDSSGKAVAYESHINLAISLLVGEKLQSSGVEVIYTRKTDKYVSLKDRVELANNNNSDLFVSIHCNSIAKPEVDGTQVYYHPVSEVGTILADNIYENIVEMTPLSPKKTQNGSHLYVIRSTVSPAALVETAFISNASDRAYLMSKEGQDKIAEAIYLGIVETLG